MPTKRVGKRSTKLRKQKIKFSVKGKVGLLFLFVVSIGFLVYFFAAHAFPKNENSLISSETESYAAGKAINTAIAATVEAENMSYLNAPDGIQTFTDAEASGGSGKLLSISNTIVSTINTEASTSKLVVRAKGDNCQGWPNIVVKVGGAVVMDKKIASGKWNDFSANIALQPGSHGIELSYTNDYETVSGKGCNRNVMVDRISLQ